MYAKDPEIQNDLPIINYQSQVD